MKPLQNTLLFISAILLLLVFGAVGMILMGLQALFLYCVQKPKGVNYFSKSMIDNALALDVFGNVLCKELFNLALSNSRSKHYFGVFPMTVSGVLGLNQQHGTLSLLGKALCWYLDKRDPGHCAKAAVNNAEYWKDYLKTKIDE